MASVQTEDLKLILSKNTLLRVSFGVILSGLAFLGNVQNLDMFFGVNFLFGGIFAWTAFLLLGPAWGICAIFVSSLYTIHLWGHGYAVVLFSLEFIFVALFQGYQKKWRMIALTLIYWISVGGLLSIFSYKFLLGLPSSTVELIVAKQALNGIFNACVGALLYYTILLMKPRIPVGTSGATFASFLQLLFCFGMIAPLGTYEIYKLNREFNDTIHKSLAEKTRQLQRDVRNITKSLDSEIKFQQVLSQYNGDYLKFYEVNADISPIAIYSISEETGAIGLEIGEISLAFEQLIAGSTLRDTSFTNPIVGCVDNLLILKTNEGGLRYSLWSPSKANFSILMGETDFEKIICMTDWTRESNLEIGVGSAEVERDTSDNVTQVGSWLDAQILSSATIAAGYPTVLQGVYSLKDVVIGFLQKSCDTVVNLFIISALSVLLSYLLNFVLVARFSRVPRLVEDVLQAGSIDGYSKNLAFREDVELYNSLRSVAVSISKEEAAQKIAAEGFLRLVEETSTPVLATNGSGKIRFWNNALERLTGFSKEEVNGKLFQNLASVDVTNAFLNSGESNHEFEFSIKVRTGKIIRLSASQTILQDISDLISAHGDQAKIQETLHFFIAQDQTEATYASAHMVHVTRMAALGEMSSSIAHELNQPLNVISMAAGNSIERMSNGSVPSEYLLGKMKRIEQQAQRAGNIIHNIREFSLASPADDIELFDPVMHCKSAVEIMSEQLRLDSIALELPDFSESVLIEGRPILFEQVIVNIINNARQAMNSLHTKSRICRFEFKIENDFLRIEVSDTGPGVKGPDLTKIFDPFYSTKGSELGTGIGLYMSKIIVSAMLGDISAYNGKTGAAIVLRFPIAEIISE